MDRDDKRELVAAGIGVATITTIVGFVSIFILKDLSAFNAWLIILGLTIAFFVLVWFCYWLAKKIIK